MSSGTASIFRHQFWIVLAGAAIFFIGLGRARLWDEDEAEYSRCAREMMARGDWVVPTLNYEAWLEKPVLVYWLMIGSFHVFGPTEFAARCPSALMALGTALLTYHLGRRLFRPQIGLWAGLILSSSLMFVVIARAATLDSALIFFTTMSLWAYVVVMPKEFWQSSPAMPAGSPAGGSLDLSMESSSSRIARFRAVLPRSWWSFAAMYVPLGMAVMVKGPVGVLLPIAALGMFVWISGSAALAVQSESTAQPESPAQPDDRWRRIVLAARNVRRRLAAMAADFPAATWAMRPLTLAAIVLVVAAPWYVLAGIRTHGEFWRVFIWEHNVQYILHPQQGHAGSSLYYYPLALVIGFFPWTLGLGLGVAGAARRMHRGEPSGRASGLAVTWSVTWFVVMSLVGTKLPHYIVPAYPTLAVLAAIWITEWIAAPKTQRADRWMAGGLAALGFSGIAMAVGLPLAIRHWAPGQAGCAWLGMILVVGASIGWLLHFNRRPAAAAVTLVATAGTLFIAIFGVAGPQFSTQQSSVQMTDAVERLGTPDTRLGLFRIYLPGLLYYADRPQRIAELKTPAEVEGLIGPNGDYLVITNLPGLIELRPHLPGDAVVLESQPRFLKGSELFVVGRERRPSVNEREKAGSAKTKVANGPNTANPAKLR
jgi:4-amino-4-deoxy-L-arabinose transferase-like glycosyltransferase